MEQNKQKEEKIIDSKDKLKSTKNEINNKDKSEKEKDKKDTDNKNQPKIINIQEFKKEIVNVLKKKG